MNASQNLQNSSENLEFESFLLTPKAPNLRPAASPEIEFEDLLLPEALLGEEDFLLEENDEEFEDFFLDSEEKLEEKFEENAVELNENSSKKFAEEQVQRDHKMKVARNTRPLFQNKRNCDLNEANFAGLQNDYQMSRISDINFSAEGVVELIFRKKSISI